MEQRPKRDKFPLVTSQPQVCIKVFRSTDHGPKTQLIELSLRSVYKISYVEIYRSFGILAQGSGEKTKIAWFSNLSKQLSEVIDILPILDGRIASEF